MVAVGLNTELPESQWSKRPVFNPDLSRKASLTEKETEILQLVAIGEADEDIGRELSLTARAVTTVLRTVFKKIDTPDRFQAALWAGKNL